MRKREYCRYLSSQSRPAAWPRQFASSNHWGLIRGIGCRLALAVMASVFLSSPLGAAGSLEPRVRIPKYAEVQGKTIRLSDLLPPDAPAELSEIGTRIVLGDAPLPARQRVISKDQMVLELREFPSVRERLELPERLTISSKQRRLSPEEVRTAVETFLAAQGLGAPGVVPQKLLSYPSPVFVTRQDPGLVVKRIEADRVRRQIRFLLWTSSEPQVLPFYVAVDVSATSAASAPSNQLAAWLEGHGPGVPVYRVKPSSRTTPPSFLVTKGKPAKLVVETGTLRMTALVTPLESGAKGQQIRVKNPDTQRVFKAEVVGEDLLADGRAGNGE